MKRTRSPFKILGVSPKDDMTTIRMAWREKVRRLHPDLAEDKVAATADLAEVNAAFDALQGHVPKGRKAKAPPRRAEKAKARPKTAPKAKKPEKVQPEPAAQPDIRTEALRQQSMSRLSAEMQARSNRARTEYARARDIVAVA